MRITLQAYHGTSRSARDQIKSEGQFWASKDSTEWAGSGIYFFIEEDPAENARKWAVYIKQFSNPAVIRAVIEIDPDAVFDLTTAKHQKWFHQYREAYYKKAADAAARAGRRIDADVLNRMKLDCRSINEICESAAFDGVKRQCYIRFKHLGIWKNYCTSAIPNCTIFCLREESCIKHIN